MDMKTCFRLSSIVWVPLLLALLIPAFAQASAKDSSAKTTGRPQPRSVPDVPIPQSVFAVGEGHNPFFPQSTPRAVVAKPTKENPIETFNFVLNGITSPPRRTAMINGRTFEPGEEGEVKFTSGQRMMIKCVEIKADSATIEVNGQRRELKLRSGL
jgi:hypothetical protein